MADSLFARIVCGVDGTPASTEAVHRAVELAEDGSKLLLVSVVDEASAAAATSPGAGIVLPPPTMELEQSALAQAAVEVRARAPRLKVESKVLEGPVLPTLIGELGDANATLAVVGRHGHSRLAGRILGSAMTAVLHDAPCSVLAAGAVEEGVRFPRSIVVGYDGSEQADAAARAASEIAHRTEAPLEAVCARHGKEVPVDELQGKLTAVAPGITLSVVDKDPVDALLDAEADLVVVGHRGLHGMKSLGSVSERVAHKAHCSVLVVR
jgi:nucleotide-binding universal stress UspA family protein